MIKFTIDGRHSEWDYESYKSNYFDDFNKKINLLKSVCNDFVLYKNKILELVLIVLKRLRKDKVVHEDLVLVFSISDSDEYQIELEVIEQTNNAKDYLEFKSWIETLSD